MKAAVALSFACLAVIFMTAGADPAREVKIESGTVIPALRETRTGKPYMAFLGIPYAEPPVGDLRFQPPVKAKPWEGVYNATELKPICLHYEPFVFKTSVGEEDCLYLNVFVPGDQVPKSKLPVMVFLHNGAYMWGSGIFYGGAYFMDEPVIVVIPNWRLSILGFLNAGVPEAQGNQAMKDQVLALKWVQDNIEHLGGDKDQVTVFGDLAGGSSVHYHMYAPMSKGLFSRAISQGGSVLCPWAFDLRPRRTVQKVAAFLDLPTKNMSSAVKSMQKMDARNLTSVIPKLFEWDANPINLFGPSAETTEGDSSTKFLDTTPYKFLQKPPVNNVPWIQGINDELGLLAAKGTVDTPALVKDLKEDWQTIAPFILYFRDTALDRAAVADAIKKEYFGNRDINNETLKEFSDLLSHRTFTYGDRKAVLSHLNQTKDDPKDVYLYYFNKQCKKSIVGADGPYGSSEGDELQFLYNTSYPFYEFIKPDNEDFNFSQNFIRLWVHFATHGNTEYKWNGTQELKWEPVNRTEVLEDAEHSLGKYLYINEAPEIGPEPFANRNKFWNTVSLNEYENELVVDI